MLVYWQSDVGSVAFNLVSSYPNGSTSYFSNYYVPGAVLSTCIDSFNLQKNYTHFTCDNQNTNRLNQGAQLFYWVMELGFKYQQPDVRPCVPRFDIYFNAGKKFKARLTSISIL